VKSRSTKAIILASGQALSTLVGLITAAVLARLFTKLDYATYRQTMLAYAFAAPFAMLGFNQALFYFLPTEKDRPRGVLVENLLLLATGGLLLTVFLLCGGNELLARRFNNPSLATTLLILSPYPLLMLLAASLGACLLARDHAGQVALFNVASRLVMLVAVLVPCLIWPTPAVAIAGVVSATLLTTTIALILMFRACQEGDWRPSLTSIRKQISFSIPLGLAGLAGAISLSLDKVMVAALCAPTAFAVYVNGAMEIPLIGIITGSIFSVLIVDFRKLYSAGALDELRQLLHRAITKTSVALIPVMFFLLVVAPEVVTLIFGAEYRASATVFRIYLLLLPTRLLMWGAIFISTGKSQYVLYFQILILSLNALGTWWAISIFGPFGAAISTVAVVYLVADPIGLVVLGRILNCPLKALFPWKNLCQVFVVSGLPAGLLFLVHKSHQGMSPMLLLCLLGISYATVVALLLQRLDLFAFQPCLTKLRSLMGSQG